MQKENIVHFVIMCGIWNVIDLKEMASQMGMKNLLPLSYVLFSH